MIGNVVKLTGSVGASLLDPCAGEGRAAAILAKRWGVVAHGVELHKERAGVAKELLSWARHGSYHQLTAVDAKGEALDPDIYSPSEGARPFGILFLNPPYDEGTDETGKSLRQEVEFLRATTRFLAPGGVLVFVPPRKILKNEVFREYMRTRFRDIRVYAFPEPEIEAFDQVVMFARRAISNYSCSDISVFDDEPTSLENAPSYEASVSVIAARISLVGRTPESYAPDDNEGAWLAQQWIAQTGEGVESETAPLVAPRPGHQAMLLAAGTLNGLEITTESSKLLVKGGSRKVISVVEGQTDDEGNKEVIHRERISSYLSVLNLSDGVLDSWQVENDATKTGDWFKSHGPELAAGILATHTPQFDRQIEAYDFSALRAPGILPGRTEPEILQVQKEAAAAVVHRWYGTAKPSRRSKGHKAVILCGEMGTGKTSIAVTASELSRSRKTVIVCPTHLTKKWVREIEIITGRKGCALVPKKLSDVDKFFASEEKTYLVLSKETAKLGSRWVSVAARGSRLIEKEEKRVDREDRWYPRTYTEMVTRHDKFDACPSCGKEVLLNTKAQSKCKDCGEPLYRFEANTTGTKRWPLAAYIHDRYARRYTLVVDEAHQHAAGETDQARAVHQIITGAKKVLMMTGTLYGGRASSIFYLLYRLDSNFRRTYKHTDCATFVEHHGLFETVYKEEERTSTYGYRKGNKGGRIREIPGMSPAMIPMLLPYTIFVKLKDLQLELPSYAEEVVLVDPDPEVRSAVSRFQGHLKSLLREHPKILGSYLQACLGFPDRADQDEAIYDIGEDGEPGELLLSMSGIPDASYPKDEALIELVRKEHTEGRKVLVFFTQTNRRDARGRVKAALEAMGLRVVQLDSSVSPEKREDWLRAQCEKGFDVMLTNGKLVETGLDLIFANTIVQYGTEYSINTLRQSIRRSWRLGQNKPVRVIFLSYRGTMQAMATDLIARKMRAAELVDGDTAGGLAQFDAGGGNFLLELAYEALAA
jgi:superfamily II DNA or RNA helicase/16S rRNA G966 N2-methylase RsmD